MTGKQNKNEKVERHVYLSERTKRWDTWLEIGMIVIALAFALFCAAYAVDGFWIALWNALKQI